MEILVISGLSGAGKSCAASCLEDIGYYTVDNMPAAIIPKFVGASLNISFLASFQLLPES